MACITRIEQRLDRSWEGHSVKTGQVRPFKTLADYEQYTKSLEAQGTYCPSIDPIHTQGYKPGKNTTHTGFLEFQPRDAQTQAKYSAMSPTWEGIQSSEAAIARGDYDLDRAEKTRQELRGKQPAVQTVPQGPETSWNCSVQ
jgi:hypothetical protein